MLNSTTSPPLHGCLSDHLFPEFLQQVLTGLPTSTAPCPLSSQNESDLLLLCSQPYRTPCPVVLVRPRDLLPVILWATSCIALTHSAPAILAPLPFQQPGLPPISEPLLVPLPPPPPTRQIHIACSSLISSNSLLKCYLLSGHPSHHTPPTTLRPLSALFLPSGAHPFPIHPITDIGLVMCLPPFARKLPENREFFCHSYYTSSTQDSAWYIIGPHEIFVEWINEGSSWWCGRDSVELCINFLLP